MDQKKVQIYALDLYRFLLLRRLEFFEENMQPTQIGCEPESQFSDVVGKAILTLCHKEQFSYWAWFIRDKDYMLRDYKSFLITAAVYAEFLYNSSTSPSKVGALLQFSAVLLEMVTFAFVFGQKDYIFISPIIWEKLFELFFGDHLSSDLSVLDESAEELARVYDNSECETCENGKIKVKGWLNTIEQSRDIKSLLLGSSLCSGRASDLHQLENVMPEEPNAGCEIKMESDCKDVNSSGATSDVEMQCSKNEFDLVPVSSGDKEAEFLAVSKNTGLVSSLECTDWSNGVFSVKHPDSPDAHMRRKSGVEQRLDWLQSYARDFQNSGSLESFEEFSIIHKYISKAFKVVKNKFPNEVMKYRSRQNKFCRLAKFNSEFTKKANEIRIMAYYCTKDASKRKKGEQSSSDSRQDAEEVEAPSANEVQQEDSAEAEKKLSDSGKVKDQVSSNRTSYIPTHPGACSSASALRIPPRPQDITGLETVESFSLEARDVEGCGTPIWKWYGDYFDYKPGARLMIQDTLQSFPSLKAFLKRRKITEGSSQQDSSALGGSTPKKLCGSHSYGQTIMPGTELSSSKQSIAQAGTTENLLPTSVSRHDEILGLGVSSDGCQRIQQTAHFGGSAAILGSGIAQGSEPQNPRSVAANRLISAMLTVPCVHPLLTPIPSPERTDSSEFGGGSSLNRDTPSEESTLEETETDDSPVNSPADSQISSGSTHHSGPTI